MLFEAIEQKRQQLIHTASLHGISSAKTIKCSKELDKLIITYQKKQVKKVSSSPVYKNIG
ncbi:hypothetical protein GCM10011391_08950 [Pullulanibacillus camelliae]|uniref:Aspartyl-phosphate phosphatase Spo0E family protein n=1 Tax=Pullulanibacillus camelliae TaxID=1707096 RepID=A0A8J2YBC2_9BACL|nr:aspartyl-phosphate phosphatase Spo0E family protein [Pullulanibacillus camelliae]GGE32471.1 hypothetical protein GCM10011391_08950 [Pullulanibacillus camelliae]